MPAYAVITFADGTKCYSGPDCMRHSGKQRLSEGFSAQNLAEKLDELDKIANNPLMTQTPVEIDNVLAGIYNEYYRKLDDMSRIQHYIDDYKERLNPDNRWYREYDTKNNLAGLAKQEAVLAGLQAEAQGILDEADPLETEFTRRGGWTRAFLVDNSNGHVHKNRHCSTCFPTTRYGWLPDYSGADENKIVEDAGEMACTVCYPTAPVDVLKRKSVMELPEKRAARLEREAAKAERDRKNAEKGITNPDGSPLKIKTGYGVVKAARTAEIEAVDIYVDQQAVANGRYGNGYGTDPQRIADKASDYNLLVTALANKFGRTYEEQDTLIQEKGAKKYKKDWA